MYNHNNNRASSSLPNPNAPPFIPMDYNNNNNNNHYHHAVPSAAAPSSSLAPAADGPFMMHQHQQQHSVMMPYQHNPTLPQHIYQQPQYDDFRHHHHQIHPHPQLPPHFPPSDINDNSSNIQHSYHPSLLQSQQPSSSSSSSSTLTLGEPDFHPIIHKTSDLRNSDKSLIIRKQHTPRPGIGHVGKQIQVRGNFFPVTSLPSNNVYHYELSILPEVPPSKNRKIFQLWESDYQTATSSNIKPVYDGRRNVFTAKPFPFEDADGVFYVDWVENEDPLMRRRPSKRFKLIIRKVGTVDMNELVAFLAGKANYTPTLALSVIDIVLRHAPSLKFTTVGRSFYTPEACASIANGAQLWQGFHQSIRPSQGRLVVNLDVSATAFYQPGPVIDLVVKLLGRHSPNDLNHPFSEKERQKLERTLKGMKIFVTHRGKLRKRYRITKLTTTPASRTHFPIGENGVKTSDESVSNYFMSRYNMRLRYAHLPCLVVGDPSKHIYLPMEVCEVVPGQRHHRKLNERQTAEMIKYTCQPPTIRSAKIATGVTALQDTDNEYLKEFNLVIGQEMTVVPARVLPPPTICYHPASKEPVITPRDGAWNLRDKMVAQGMIMRSWCVVAFGNESDYPVTAIQKFISSLVQTSEECGLRFANRHPPISYASPQGNVEKTLIDAYMMTGNSFLERPQLIVCILPNTGVPLYAEIKRISDTVIGIASQCIQAKHMFAAKRQYCANVCLKMNVKLGGINSYLAANQLPFITERPTIIFGADVTHPSPGSVSNESIAAVVGSMDAQCSRYSAALRVQKARLDVIQDLSSMVVELLKTFYQTCQAKPERVLFYRDGISDHQFHEVVAAELEAIRAGCAALEPDYRPLITYVAVQKRHHARFFPVSKEDSDRSGNVLPGTVIELGVTHPSEFDFYLCSHPGLQGTSKPTHYHILHDENGFTPDGFQELTYRLCYLYCRATRSVSVVPPAYYAHLVAARARFHATEDLKWADTMSDTVSVASMDTIRTTTSTASNRGYTTPVVNNNGVSGGLVGYHQHHHHNHHHSYYSYNNGPGSAMKKERVVQYGLVKPELHRLMYWM